MQEQMAKNRIIVEVDEGKLTCHSTSSVSGSVKRTDVVINKGKYYLKQFCFVEVS